jgi:ribosomal protein S16
MNKKIIRLKKKGGVYFPTYDIVVCFKQKRVRGNFIERLGFFNPFTDHVFCINLMRLAF